MSPLKIIHGIPTIIDTKSCHLLNLTQHSAIWRIFSKKTPKNWQKNLPACILCSVCQGTENRDPDWLMRTVGPPASGGLVWIPGALTQPEMWWPPAEDTTVLTRTWWVLTCWGTCWTPSKSTYRYSVFVLTRRRSSCSVVIAWPAN